MIVKKDGKFVLMSKDGVKVLGTFDTEEDAKKREREIQSFSESCRVLEAGKEGKEFEVVLIEPGKSKNGITYPAELLKRSVSLFEGVQAFAWQFGKFDHLPDEVDRKGGFLKNLVGQYVNARFVEGTGVVATFKVAAQWLRDLLKNSIESGIKLPGFSIDGKGRVHESIVQEFYKIDEVTVVSNPSAGGKVLRMTASEQNKENEMNDLIKRLNEAFKLGLPGDATVERLVEAISTIKPNDAQGGVTVKEAQKLIDEALALKESKEKKAKEKKVADANLIDLKLKESKLSESSLKMVRATLNEFDTIEESIIDRVLTRQQDLEKNLKESVLKVEGQERGQGIQVGDERLDIVTKRLDAMWNFNEIVDGVKPYGGLHEAVHDCLGFYGDSLETAQIIMTAMNLGNRPAGSRMTESEYRGYLKGSSDFDKSFAHFSLKESTTTTADFATALSNSMNRFLIKAYRQPNRQNWQKFVTIKSAKDFRPLRSVRIGGFDDLSDVNEDQAYSNFDKPSDEESTYSVTKHGNTYPVSIEAITDDDIGVMRRSVQKMGQAAIRTLNKAVMNVFVTNANMDYDATPLFDSSGHSNTTTSALSSATLRTGLTAIADQTELDSGEILGLQAAYLIVTSGNWANARDILNNRVTMLDGRAETVPNDFINDFGLELIVDPDLTTLDSPSNNNWYLAVSPSDSDGIDVSFLGGRREPEMFVQNQQTVGSVFNADVITWKIRHIWAVKATEHRAFYGGIVA